MIRDAIKRDDFLSALEARIGLVCQHESRKLFDWQISQSLEDLLRLNRGEDAFYDSPGSGILYASWYQPRRITSAMEAIWPSLDRRSEETEIQIVDIGAGLGATAMAVAGWFASSLRCVQALPRIRILAIDSSPFCVSLGRLLVDEAIGIAQIGSQVEVEWQLASWVGFRRRFDAAAWITGLFTIDHSDAKDAMGLAQALHEIADATNAGQITLTSSTGKARVLNEVVTSIESRGWTPRAVSPREQVRPTVPFEGISRLKSELADRLPQHKPHLAPLPTWTESHFECREVSRPTQAVLKGHARLIPNLDPDQRRASSPTGLPRVVSGAAGSGKTLVAAELVVRTLEEWDRVGLRDRRILVTSFNKRLIDEFARLVFEKSKRLLSWTSPIDVFRDKSRGDWELRSESGNVVNLLNWDKVVQRFWETSPPSGGDDKRYKDVADSSGISVPGVDSAGLPSFLEAEHLRIFWGRCGGDEARYRTVDRKGRKVPLQQATREALLSMFQKLSGTFVHSRCLALFGRLKLPEGRPFDLVVIDEAQDFTQYDLVLVRRLLDDKTGLGNLFLTFDPLQSLKLGATFRLDPIGGTRWPRAVRLKGSYRMPRRLCECLQPLAQALAKRQTKHREAEVVDLETDSLVARREAVIGCRPIVVSGDRRQVSEQIAEIAKSYSELLVRQTCEGKREDLLVLDRDPKLKKEIERNWLDKSLTHRRFVQTLNVREAKGLELAGVVWSTGRSSAWAHEAVDETIYTILTRSCGLLIIALSVSTSAEAADFLRHLRFDRLQFWTEHAMSRFEAIVGKRVPAEDHRPVA
jgi:DNA helicase-2/ATP-dependent DNA helicase PcrA